MLGGGGSGGSRGMDGLCIPKVNVPSKAAPSFF